MNKNITFRVDNKTYEILQEIHKITGIPVSAIIREGLEVVIKGYKQKLPISTLLDSADKMMDKRDQMFKELADE